MTQEVNIEKLDAAMALIQEVKTDLQGQEPPSNIIDVPLGVSLQGAIDVAAPGSILRLEAGVYLGSITITKPLSLQTRNIDNVEWDPAMPTIIQGTGEAVVTAASQDSSGWVELMGIGLKSDNPAGDLFVVKGVQTHVDRISCLGHPSQGAHRGILAHGQKMRFEQIWVDDVFLYGRDTTALGGWDGTKDLTVDKAYLCGAGEAILFGGADSKSADRIPSNIRITNFHLTKKPAWYTMTSGGQGINIKNSFELKSAVGVYLGDGTMEYAGTSQGQGAYIMLFTVRNQDGNAPWSTVKDVLVERVSCRYGGGCVQFLGSDDNHPSGTLENVTLRNVSFSDINPKGITKGSGRCFTFDRAPKLVTLDGVTVSGVNLSQLGYFPTAKQTPPAEPVSLVMKNWVYPKTTYGWFINAGPHDVPPASTNLQAYMPDMVYSITASDAGASGAPAFPV